MRGERWVVRRDIDWQGAPSDECRIVDVREALGETPAHVEVQW
jgi:hypothetical protein